MGFVLPQGVGEKVVGVSPVCALSPRAMLNSASWISLRASSMGSSRQCHYSWGWYAIGGVKTHRGSGKGEQLENPRFFPWSSSTPWVVNPTLRLFCFLLDYSVVSQNNVEVRELERALVKETRSWGV